MFRNIDFNDPVVRWLNEYAPQGIVITDTALVIRGWNRWLEQNTDRRAEQVIGLSLFEVFPDLVARKLNRLYEDALDGRVTVLAHRFHKYLVKLPAQPGDGLSEMQQSASVAPLIRDDQVIGTITAIDDVSERVVRENELLAAREQADKANQAKDRFLAVLSHDLRTPLTSIIGWSRIFQARPENQSVIRKGAEVIERNATVQLELIEQILDISRIRTEKLRLDTVSVILLDVVNATLDTMEPMAEAKGIALDRVMPEEQRTAALDSKRFQQIIWNLISNSLRFTSKGGRVLTTLKYRDTCFQLVITDTGKGISREALPYLFEPLWQAEGGSQGGLGLGLAITRNLVELHGGSIRAESSGPGQGATFIVEMPWSTSQRNHAG